MPKYTLTEIPLVVMLGQSNEGGHNDDSVSATITSTTDGSIFYKPDWTSTNNGTWQSPIATGVNNAQYTRIDGLFNDIGMELKLANLLKNYNGLHHYFIKLTYGGAEIRKEATQTDLNPDSVNEYYEIATDFTFLNAIEQLAGLGKVRVKAITFHQGEAEAANETWANEYYNASNPIDFANPLPYIFQELRGYHPLLNNVKVVITKVYTTSGSYPYISTIATHQTNYANSKSDVYLVDMDGSVAFSDAGVHWDAPTQEVKATNVYNIIKDW